MAAENKSISSYESVLFDDHNQPNNMNSSSIYELCDGWTLGRLIEEEKKINRLKDTNDENVSSLEFVKEIEVKPLGKGGFAQAFIITCDKKQYVLKKLYRLKNYSNITKEDALQEGLRELEILKKVKGKLWAVQLLAAQWNKDDFYLLFEYVPGITLQQYLREYSNKYTDGTLSNVNKHKKHEILNHIVDAIEHLHTLGIAHADIKPDNIFIPNEDTGRQPFLLDFGISTSLKTKSSIKNYRNLFKTSINLSRYPELYDKDLHLRIETLISPVKLEKRSGGSTRKRRKIRKDRHTRSKRKSSR